MEKKENLELQKAIDLLYEEKIISFYQWSQFMKKAKNLKQKGE